VSDAKRYDASWHVSIVHVDDSQWGLYQPPTPMSPQKGSRDDGEVYEDREVLRPIAVLNFMVPERLDGFAFSTRIPTRPKTTQGRNYLCSGMYFRGLSPSECTMCTNPEPDEVLQAVILPLIHQVQCSANMISSCGIDQALSTAESRSNGR